MHTLSTQPYGARTQRNTMTFICHSRSDFPRGFQFGVASSSYQIEGHRFGGAGSTHWDSFSATPGNVAGGADGSLACDHYHRFTEDLKLAAAAGFDVWRFSTSWARILPEGSGKVNEEGLDYYDRLVDTVCSKGLRPNLTLYHWELPSPFADIGGWVNREIPSRFAEYADIVVRRIGDRLHAVAPINEPWCVAWLSHFMGLHAPGLRDIRAAARAMHHVPLAHGLAVQAMRAAGQKNIGVVVNFEYSEPADTSEESVTAAQTHDSIYNKWFLGGIRCACYPSLALAGLEAHLPNNWEADLHTISEPIDWIGINYYTRKLIAAGPSGMFGDFQEVQGPLDKTDMGWEIYSAGLLHFLRMVHWEFSSGLPIFVTENGMANADQLCETGCDDAARIAFIDEHLQKVLQAIQENINVRGYFLWTLLDNFEWALGYEKQFGIVHVDRNSMARTPKQSYFAIKDALSS